MTQELVCYYNYYYMYGELVVTTLIAFPCYHHFTYRNYNCKSTEILAYA